MKLVLVLTSLLMYILITLAAGCMALIAIELIMHTFGYVWMDINVPFLRGVLIPLIGAPLGTLAAKGTWDNYV